MLSGSLLSPVAFWPSHPSFPVQELDEDIRGHLEGVMEQVRGAEAEHGGRRELVPGGSGSPAVLSVVGQKIYNHPSPLSPLFPPPLLFPSFLPLRWRSTGTTSWPPAE